MQFNKGLLVAAALIAATPALADTGPLSHPTVFIAAATNNLTAISRATNSVVTGAHCESIANATALYLKFYNGQPTMGTTPAVDELEIPPASSTAGNGHESAGMKDILYPLGIWIALTAGQSLTDNTAVAAGAANCTIYWRN